MNVEGKTELTWKIHENALKTGKLSPREMEIHREKDSSKKGTTIGRGQQGKEAYNNTKIETLNDHSEKDRKLKKEIQRTLPVVVLRNTSYPLG